MQVVERVLEVVGPYLEQVERQLQRAAEESGRELGLITRHMVNSGGKRIRPIMTLLSARVFSDDVSAAVPVASAAELIHMATLAHDDVIDKASTRRGSPTVNARWDNHSAVLAGDAMLAKALVMLVDHGGPAIVRLMAEMVRLMCDGEIEQKASLARVEQTETDYYSRIEKKTALFFSACCEAGALHQGAETHEVHALSEYGRNMGMAFQIVDDLLDVGGAEEVVGKPVGNDLAEGVYTLPVLYVLREERVGPKLARLLEQAPLSREQIKEILALVREHGGVEYSRDAAKSFAGRAKEHLAALPASSGRELLEHVADELLLRAY